MSRRAHIRSGQIIRFYPGEKFNITLENGDVVSPAVIGFESGNDKIVSVNETINDTSTGSNIVREKSDWVVNSNSVDRTITIRDMTAQEIEDRKDRILSELDGSDFDYQLAISKLVKAMLGKMYSDSGLTPAQFKAAIEAEKSTISVDQLKTFLKDVF